jgi:hypothetical protein
MATVRAIVCAKLNKETYPCKYNLYNLFHVFERLYNTLFTTGLFPVGTDSDTCFPCRHLQVQELKLKTEYSYLYLYSHLVTSFSVNYCKCVVLYEAVK